MSERSAKDFKLFPRNLTARADAVVRGNPVTTRPESGVENSFPGLEFDQRNLDKAFFPGLLFELHHDFGVVLRAVAPDSSAAVLLPPDAIAAGMFLVFVQGRFASRNPEVAPGMRVARFTQPAGLESWRVVRDLEPGQVAVAVCDNDTYQAIGAGGLDIETAMGWFETRESRRIELGERLAVFVLFGKRARYLTRDGVIDPDLVSSGDLTRSLCSPWQYDFADCGCFYWASNKPDLVSSPVQPEQVLNFQRKDRSEAADRATLAEDWLIKHRRAWDGEALAIRHAEMLQRWSELPFVIGGRETDRYQVITAPQPPAHLDLAGIVTRLEQLAPVEHALLVEYLYAFYSLAAPAPGAPALSEVQVRIRTASEEIFQVAVDEMRHLRAVNEILLELGRPAVIRRAEIIGEDFDHNGKGFNRPFELVPLTAAQLDWFIDVERASQVQGGDQDSIDGMYTLILRSVEASAELSVEQKSRLGQLVKVIVDEGMDHFARFTRAKKALDGIPEGTYLRVKTTPVRLPVGDPDRILQDTLDAAYVVVMRSLEYVFRLGDKQRGALFESARRAMYNMDDAARSVAERGVGCLFDPSAAAPLNASASELAPVGPPASQAHAVGEPLRAAIRRLRTTGAPPHLALADRLERRLSEMTRAFETVTDAQE